jgi:hypothetical protein
MVDKVTGRDSIPLYPDLIGVMSSSIIRVLIMLDPKSDMELKKEEISKHSFLNKLFFESNFGPREGKDRGREGSSAL